MKPTTTLIVAGLALGGWFLFGNRKARAASADGAGAAAPVLGDVPDNGVVVGPISGRSYAFAFGDIGKDGRHLVSVHNANLQLLFTYVQTPQGERRSLTARSGDPALAEQIDVALQDFGFR